jgi:hypothetical protein
MWIILLFLPALVIFAHGMAIAFAVKRNQNPIVGVSILALTVAGWMAFFFEKLPELSVPTGLILILTVLGINILSSYLLISKGRRK